MTTPQATNPDHAHDVDDANIESPQDTVSPESPFDIKSHVAHDQANAHKDVNEAKPEKPFSVYTKREKWCMIILIAIAGLFSPLASALYFPAIPTMAAAFGKSVELINLTVTMYLVFQGISPMFWGILADRIGRRPVYLMCLTLLLLSCVGLALVPTNAYWLLMVLRCFQAAGSASTIALGGGVISDIATPAERGGFLGLFMLGPMLGPMEVDVLVFGDSDWYNDRFHGSYFPGNTARNNRRWLEAAAEMEPHTTPYTWEKRI
ncbi:hypothetical protein FRC07_014283 [Ceratobasidium sp. 392]|nr:hypothetical protein FRC07_014283 [Ceratobasidium sp. 392]